MVYATSWTINESHRNSFLVLTSNPDILWYRYDTNSYGAAQNWIYLKKQKIKLSYFVDMSDQYILSLLNK